MAKGLELCARLPAGQERDAARHPLLLGLAVVTNLISGATAPELLPIVDQALAGLRHAPSLAREEEALWEAIGVARRQQARLYEVCASVALGRLW